MPPAQPTRPAASPLTLRVSEIFDSVQGEGAGAGLPCRFLRLATCNLRCRWCDTRYTWDWDAYRYADEVKRRSVADVAETLRSVPPERLVITGGEPLLQQPALEALLRLLAPSLFVEVETNGTLAPAPFLSRRIDQWNVSPKLRNAGEPEARRLRYPALESLRDTGRAWLKIVIAADDDASEAAELVGRLAWPPERVLLMPEARSREELRQRAPLVEAAALARGYAISRRLHIEQWDGERGR